MKEKKKPNRLQFLWLGREKSLEERFRERPRKVEAPRKSIYDLGESVIQGILLGLLLTLLATWAFLLLY